MTRRGPDFGRLLRVLAKHGVEHVVVGGVAAVLQGAPLATFDLDVVHARTPANVARLLAALNELQAVSRAQLPRRLAPEASHLTSPGHQLLDTAAGPLDVLGEIGHGRGYEDLRPHAVPLVLADDLTVLVLDLATLIAVKQESGRDKDLAVLPLLRATLAERERA